MATCGLFGLNKLALSLELIARYRLFLKFAAQRLELLPLFLVLLLDHLQLPQSTFMLCDETHQLHLGIVKVSSRAFLVTTEVNYLIRQLGVEAICQLLQMLHLFLLVFEDTLNAVVEIARSRKSR